MCIPIPLFFWILLLVLTLGWLLGAMCFSKTITLLKSEIKENEEHSAFLLVQQEMNEELLKRGNLPGEQEPSGQWFVWVNADETAAHGYISPTEPKQQLQPAAISKVAEILAKAKAQNIRAAS